MLYSRACDYLRKHSLLYTESFSPNTPEGACPNCHGVGHVHQVSRLKPERMRQPLQEFVAAVVMDDRLSDDGA
jgi:excinuclease UvrABC ATPase subunit